MFYGFFFHTLSSKSGAYFTFPVLAAFWVLSSHIWLVATRLESAVWTVNLVFWSQSRLMCNWNTLKYEWLEVILELIYSTVTYFCNVRNSVWFGNLSRADRFLSHDTKSRHGEDPWFLQAVLESKTHTHTHLLVANQYITQIYR